MDRHFYVYLLRCSDGSYYTGHTDDLDARLWQHCHGIGCDWTRRRRPVDLVWCDVLPTRDEAFTAERRIKNWSVAKKQALIAGDWPLVGYFARPPHERLSQRPSTSLGTNEDAAGGTSEDAAEDAARPERSRGASIEHGGAS